MKNIRSGHIVLQSLLTLIVIGALHGLTACSSVETEAKYPTGYDRPTTGGDIYASHESIFGGGGLFGRNKGSESGDSGIGVNSFLWRASLDTVSFMPLANADPFGGTILTDWYSPPEAPGERYKANVFILGKQLRSDGVRVRIFKQQQSKKGAWQDVAVPDDTGRQLEDAILTRARQLRISQTGPVEE